MSSIRRISESSSRRESTNARASLIPQPNSTPSVHSSRVAIPSQSLGELVWETVSPLVWKLTVFYTKIFLLLASVGIFVITTVLLYSLVYYLAVPKRLHSYPVFFNYAGEGHEHTVCANVTLAGRQWEGISRPIKDWDRPSPGYDFDVSLGLEFPTTEYNLARGPITFETKAAVRDHSVIAMTQRGFLIPQMSALGRLFRDLVTMAVSGLYLYRDQLSVDVDLIESLPVLHHEALSFVSVCMSPPMHVYSASLNFVSKLSGFRYLIAHHPFFVGFFVVAVVVALAVISLAIAATMRYFKDPNGQIHDEDEIREPVSPISPREEIIGGESTSEGDVLRRRSVRD